jgi:protein gp37
MSTNSAIEWTDCTWNPVAGCTPVSPGCLNCYAATMTRRLDAMGQEKYHNLITTRTADNRAVFTGRINLDHDSLTIPLHWKKPRRIFVNSMSDLFHKDVPFEFIDRVFAVMALCPQHTFQVLTKRPERMAEYFKRTGSMEDAIDRVGRIIWNMAEVIREGTILNRTLLIPSDERERRWPPRNVWLGTSTENQQTADERIPHLLRCPAAVRFLSVEPLLGAVDLRTGIYLVSTGLPGEKLERGTTLSGIDLVICGGESGPGARPCDVAWIRSIVQQCKAAGVKCFCKQLGANPYDICPTTNQLARLHCDDPKGGAMNEWPADLRVREMPEVGK